MLLFILSGVVWYGVVFLDCFVCTRCGCLKVYRRHIQITGYGMPLLRTVKGLGSNIHTAIHLGMFTIVSPCASTSVPG